MADIYLRRGPYRERVNPDDCDYARVPAWVKIVLDGPKGSLSLLIPTDGGPDRLDPGLFEHWVPAIQGPIVNRLEGTDEQREQLLHVALAIHAFTEGFPDVDPNDFHHFMGRLVAAALSCEPDECAEGQFDDLVEWLHQVLPERLFYGNHVPPVTEEEYDTPLVWQLTTGKLSMPVFSRLSAPGPVHVDEGSAVGSEAVEDNASVSSSGSMPPLVDESDSD